MHHEGADHGVAPATRKMFGVELERLKEAEAADPAALGHVPQILDGSVAVYLQREHGGVRSDDHAFAGGAAESDRRNTKCAIAIVLGVVAGIVCRFRNSPWHAQLAGIALVNLDHGVEALLKQGSVEGLHEQRR